MKSLQAAIMPCRREPKASASLALSLKAIGSIALWLAVTGSIAQAGLSALEVVVVVNGQSQNSRTLANYYVQLRGIPSPNVIVLNEVPASEKISVDQFRDKILRPLLQTIDQRRLSGHIQCIAYSCDFPTAIDISLDLREQKNLNKVFTKVASINGLTYLYDLVLKGDPAYITPEINFYARRPMGAYFTNPGGKETEEQWSDINLLKISGEYEKASDELDKLIDKLPYQYPLRYLSAAYAAKANLPEKALKRLEEAIDRGWNSGGYLNSDSDFDSIRDTPELKLLSQLLDTDRGQWQPTVPFNSRSVWAANGVEFAAQTQSPSLGLRYMLSMVLGVTRGLGNSMEQSIQSLKTAAQADYTHPTGGFYFASTGDVRTKARKTNFSAAIEELQSLGFEAEAIIQSLPTQRPAVLGAQLGSARLDWSTSGSTIIPGAIVENLTSLGGVMSPPKSQTPLTDFIAAGAAASSGTVAEPYAVPFKFPSPWLYVHYAQGLSLAEAYYQSVTGPYQLLIVGDPLCQPFSIAPSQPQERAMQSVPLSGSYQFQPDLSGPSYSDWQGMNEPPAKRRQQLRPSKVAIQIDGGTPQGGPIQPTVNVKLDRLAGGYHEIQVILVSDDPLNQRHQQTIPVWIGDKNLIKLELAPTDTSPSMTAGLLNVSVSTAPGCSEAAIFHHAEIVATAKLDDSTASLTIDLKQLGLGPVRLQAKAKMQDGEIIASQPLWIDIVP